MAVTHVDGIFAVGRKKRCDRHCDDLHKVLPGKCLGEVTQYSACHIIRDRVEGTLTVSQKRFPGIVAVEYQHPPMWLMLMKSDEVAVRELVGSLMWLSN